MNFDESIKKHAAWKQRLALYVSQPDHSLKSSEVSAERNCDLGKWINGEGAKYSMLPEFAKLKQAHTRFHVAAGEVVRKADAGENVSQEIVLGGASVYAKASTEVVSAIMAMQQRAH